MQYNTDSINHLIRNRRSVFPDQFNAGKPIPDAIIQEILTNATWGPRTDKMNRGIFQYLQATTATINVAPIPALQ